MKNLVIYFYPKHEISYFEKLKTLFFILQIFIGIPLILILSISELISPSDNFFISFFSKLSYFIFFLFSLFIVKKKGIKTAGNIFSITLVVIILIWMNILPLNITPFYKYVQGFYSVFIFLVLGILFASRPILLLNAGLILISTTRIFFYAKAQMPEHTNFLSIGYITHSVTLFCITVIIYFANKFTESTIEKLNEETINKELKNQELEASEEEIRAANEELVATTDALIESNNELIIAKEKAEESNRLKTKFLNNISHEVRTPMNGIIGFSKLLNKPDITKKDQIEFTGIINNCSSQLQKIIDDILEISKLETIQQRIFENEICINSLCSELLSVFEIDAKKKNIKLNFEKGLSDIESTVKLDSSKLIKILNNLIENAVKFTTTGYVDFGYILKNNKLEFFVKDSGIGISPNNHDKIFERFSQEYHDKEFLYGGLGLGLSIAKENTKLLNGEIWVESEKGKGAKFFVTIPYNPVNLNNYQRQ